MKINQIYYRQVFCENTIDIVKVQVTSSGILNNDHVTVKYIYLNGTTLSFRGSVKLINLLVFQKELIPEKDIKTFLSELNIDVSPALTTLYKYENI